MCGAVCGYVVLYPGLVAYLLLLCSGSTRSGEIR